MLEECFVDGGYNKMKSCVCVYCSYLRPHYFVINSLRAILLLYAALYFNCVMYCNVAACNVAADVKQIILRLQ